MCDSCVNSVFLFYSIDNEEFSDLFKNFYLKNFCSNELNAIFHDDSLDICSNDSENQNIFQQSLNDLYFTPHKLDHLTQNHSNYFSTMSINVRSLVNSRNFNKFESLVTALANKPDIIAINETWEKHDSFGEYKNLSGYTYISNPRLKSKGGRVGLYIKDKLVFSLNSDLTMNKKYFESIFITIQFNPYTPRRVILTRSKI